MTGLLKQLERMVTCLEDEGRLLPRMSADLMGCYGADMTVAIRRVG